MKFWLRFSLVLTGALLAQAVTAGPWQGWNGGMVQVQMQRPPPNQFQRQAERDFRRPEPTPGRDQRADGRLTEEERRNLHRDLDRANREIYKGRQ